MNNDEEFIVYLRQFIIFLENLNQVVELLVNLAKKFDVKIEESIN